MLEAAGVRVPDESDISDAMDSMQDEKPICVTNALDSRPDASRSTVASAQDFTTAEFSSHCDGDDVFPWARIDDVARGHHVAHAFSQQGNSAPSDDMVSKAERQAGKADESLTDTQESMGKRSKSKGSKISSSIVAGQGSSTAGNAAARKGSLPAASRRVSLSAFESLREAPSSERQACKVDATNKVKSGAWADHSRSPSSKESRETVSKNKRQGPSVVPAAKCASSHSEVKKAAKVSESAKDADAEIGNTMLTLARLQHAGDGGDAKNGNYATYRIKAAIEKYAGAAARFKRYPHMEKLWERGITYGFVHWKEIQPQEKSLVDVIQQAKKAFEAEVEGGVTIECLSRALGCALTRFLLVDKFKLHVASVVTNTVKQLGQHGTVKIPSTGPGKEYYEACQMEVLRGAVADLQKTKVLDCNTDLVTKSSAPAAPLNARLLSTLGVAAKIGGTIGGLNDFANMADFDDTASIKSMASTVAAEQPPKQYLSQDALVGKQGRDPAASNAWGATCFDDTASQVSTIAAGPPAKSSELSGILA